MEKKNKQTGPGARYGNRNAEVWTIEVATKLYDDMLQAANDDGYDFIGTLRKNFMVGSSTIVHINDKFPELKSKWNLIREAVESNCFESAKSSRTSAAYLLNLKSNHGWTDRIKTDNIQSIKPFDINDLLGFDGDE